MPGPWATECNGILALNSVVIGLLTAAATLALALPVAYWLRYCAGRWQMPCLFIITGSMFASYPVRIYAWRTILGTRGVFNQGLEALGVIDEPVGFLLYNRFSVTLALVHLLPPALCGSGALSRASGRPDAGLPGIRPGPGCQCLAEMAAE